MTDKVKNIFTNYWQVAVSGAFIIFSVGYLKAQYENKPDRVEVKEVINEAIEKNNCNIKNNYIEINKIPGLQERLKNIDDGIQELKERFDKFDNKIYSIKK
jgi:predicted nuclease with TOPRIM domain